MCDVIRMECKMGTLSHTTLYSFNLPDPSLTAPLLHLFCGIEGSVGLSSQSHLHITMALLCQLKGE